MGQTYWAAALSCFTRLWYMITGSSTLEPLGEKVGVAFPQPVSKNNSRTVQTHRFIQLTSREDMRRERLTFRAKSRKMNIGYE